jgi:hypothetical protein
MATSLTFTSLTADMQAYLERGGSAAVDPVVFAQIPRLINLAERAICNALKLQGQLEVLADASGDQSLRIGVPVITKPDRWRQTVSMNYGAGAAKNTRTPLFPRGYEFCRTYWPDDSQTAAPLFYADYDLKHWLITPTPDLNYPLEALCYMQPQLLDAVNQTNFFTDYTPNALLYGALLEAAPFLKNDERMPVWEKMWQTQLAFLKEQDLQKILDRSTQRRAP